jgi:hypothetical protein
LARLRGLVLDAGARHDEDAMVSERPETGRASEVSPLKGMIGWYEGADGRCGHEIFGDIFLLASST